MGNWYGYFLVIASAALFGASSVVVKFTYSTGLAPIPVLIMQNTCGMILAWGWVIASRKSAKLPRPLVPRMAAQGVLGGFLTSILFYTALGQLGAALATLLLYTYPAFVVLYGVLFRDYTLGVSQKTALAMALVGIIFCVDILEAQVGRVALWAVALALGSAVTNAFISINGERLLAVCETPVVTAWALTFSTATMYLAYQPLWLLEANLSDQQMALVAGGAFLCNIPLMLYFAGLKRIGANISAIVSTVEIPFTLILAWLILQETLNGYQIVGGVLIMASVIILYRQRIE